MLVDSNIKLAKTTGFINPLAMMTHMQKQFPQLMETGDVRALKKYNCILGSNHNIKYKVKRNAKFDVEMNFDFETVLVLLITLLFKQNYKLAHLILLELLTGPQHTIHCKEYKTTHESLQKVKNKSQL